MTTSGIHAPTKRRWPWLVAIGLVVLAALVATGVTLGLSPTRSQATSSPAAPGSGHGGGGSTPATARGSTTTTRAAPALVLRSSTPASGARAVATDTEITLHLSTPVSLRTVRPSINPAIAGTWRLITPTALQFVPVQPMIPFSSETVTVPGGSGGLRAVDGQTLAEAVSIRFTVAGGSILRLQQLLAEQRYLPLRFTARGSGPVGRDAALPQRGSLAWRYTGLPVNLTSLWTPGASNVLTKAAVMSFEHQQGLSVDGVAGPAVWQALLRADAHGVVDSSPYTYVLVSKTLPQHLTLYVRGAARFSDIAVNTGAPGADTADGTFPVFEHVTASEMKGTNPDGSTYDDPNVPWASYFNGGDALHGFVRAQYGFPQSNGCVEMAVSDAQTLWPYTPIGTLVTVVGATVR